MIRHDTIIMRQVMPTLICFNYNLNNLKKGELQHMARDLAKQKAYRKKWRAEHAEQLREYKRRKAREYYWENPEKFKKRRKEYRANNLEKEKAYSKKYKAEHAEKIREYNKSYMKAYRSEHQEEHRISSAEQRKKHPDEVKARSAANHAIRDGKIIPKACEICGEEKAQAHHDDYNFPLKVRWLCVRCHNEWHKNNKPIRVEKGNV